MTQVRNHRFKYIHLLLICTLEEKSYLYSIDHKRFCSRVMEGDFVQVKLERIRFPMVPNLLRSQFIQRNSYFTGLPKEIDKVKN